MKLLQICYSDESFYGEVNDEDWKVLCAILRVWAEKAKPGTSATLLLTEKTAEELAQLEDVNFPTWEDVTQQ